MSKTDLAIEAVQALIRAEKELALASLHLKRMNLPLSNKIETIREQLTPFVEAYHRSMEAIVINEAYQRECNHPDDKNSHT